MSGLVTDAIQELRPYAAGKPLEELARERGITDAIKLASNENPLGPSPKAVQAAANTLAGMHRYPDARAYALRQRLARHLNVEPDELIFGNGSNEIIELLIRTFTTSQHHIVFGEPSFVVYRSAAMAHGVRFSAVPLRDGAFDLERAAREVGAATRLIFIANPNNPTGGYVAEPDLVAFLERLGEDKLVVLDEAYFEYVTARDYPDGLAVRRRFPNVVSLRTFSKAYGLASLRIGYAVASSEVCDYLNRVRAPFNVSGVAQAAALAALDDDDFLRRVVELNRIERDRVAAALRKIGLSVTPSQANFLLFEVPEDAAVVHDALLDRGVIVRPIPGLAESLRVSLGTPEENDRFLRALGAALDREIVA